MIFWHRPNETIDYLFSARYFRFANCRMFDRGSDGSLCWQKVPDSIVIFAQHRSAMYIWCIHPSRRKRFNQLYKPLDSHNGAVLHYIFRGHSL